MAPPLRGPLVLTRDETLLDELLRLAAAAGLTPEVTGEAGVALRSWADAGLVLVGADVASELARLAPPRRSGVHLATRGPAPDATYRTAVALGAAEVLELPSDGAWLSEVLADLGDHRPGRGVVLGVVAGSGGAGATTLACALGQMAARSGPACVVDLDPLGPGCDRVLGLDAAAGVGWADLERTSGRIGAGSLRDALPRGDGPGVLTWGEEDRSTLRSASVREALSAAVRGHDAVVLDLPRAAGEVGDEVIARCDRVVLVTIPTVAGVAQALRVARGLPVDRTLVVSRGPGVAADELAEVTGLPVVAAVPDQRGVEEAVDLGLGPLRSRRGPLARACRAVLEVLPVGAPA